MIRNSTSGLPQGGVQHVAPCLGNDENDVSSLGNAPLDAFELAEVLGVLKKIQPDLIPPEKIPTLMQRILGNVDRGKQPTLELPDCSVSQRIALAERFPRHVTLVIDAIRWQVNIDKMRLFACQLRHRAALREGDATFVRAWIGEWMAEQAKQPVVRRQRFLLSLSIADAALLFSIAPSDNRSDWLAACSSAVRSRLPSLMNDMLTDEQCAEAARIILAHKIFPSLPVY